MPRMYHPDLDAYIDATERQAPNRRASGWIDVDWVDVVEKPNVSDPKADWVEWAEAQGIENPEELTKQQLVDFEYDKE